MGLLHRLAREPLVHFLGIGALVFALYGHGRTVPAAPAETVITVAPTQVERLTAQFQAVWRRSPSEAELATLVEDHVREEIYYREALALRFDRDDTVIRRRLRQKMEFLSAGSTSALDPDEAELRAHHAAHPELFAAPARVTFRQVALDDAGAAAGVRAALEAGTDPEGLVRLGLLPSGMAAAGETAVDGAFGPGFFERIAALSPGGWQGPVASAYGLHLVELLGFEPGTVQPFEAVRSRVAEDWQRSTADALRQAQYDSLRARYEVVFPEVAE
jgi:hypothetical protein